MNERFISCIVSAFFLMVTANCPYSVNGGDSDDEDGDLSHPEAVVATPVQRGLSEDQGLPVAAPLSVPMLIDPSEATLEVIFTSFQDTLTLRGFTCMGEDGLGAASQGAGDLTQRGNLVMMSPFCPWYAPVSMDEEAINKLAENPMTKIFGENLKEPGAVKSSVQFFAYFPRMFSAARILSDPQHDEWKPSLIMVKRLFRESDPTVSATAIEGFLESVASINTFLVPSEARHSQLRQRVFSEPRKIFISQELYFLTSIDVREINLEHQEKMTYMHIAALWGWSQAQSELGFLYLYGKGVVQDDAEAFRYYKLAADQGLAQAQSQLGSLYLTGRGVVKNDAEAFRYYKLAADQGFVQAQSELGLLYLNGRGVTQDDAEGFRYTKLAADQGVVWAQCKLGFLYLYGKGVVQDDAEAFRYYKLAADQGFVQAQSELGLLYLNGQGVAQDDAEAFRYTKLAADKGLASAQVQLGLLYLNGRGVAQDDAEAFRHTKLAADQGFAEAQWRLGLLYLNGQGVAQDDAEAFRYTKLAADKGSAEAQSQLGFLYLNGRGVAQDDAEAFRYTKMAADQGNLLARHKLIEISRGNPLSQATRNTPTKREKRKKQ